MSRVLHNFSLREYNTFGIDAKATFFCEFESVDDLKKLLNESFVLANRHLVIGQGSNLLFLNDFDGVVFHSAMRDVVVLEQTDESVLLEVGSGLVWDDLVGYCVEHGWAGIENLSLIPGETGAAAVQNIGAYGVEVREVVQKVKGVDIASSEERIFDISECGYGYRQSVFKKELKGRYILTSVVIRLSLHPVFNLSYQHLEQAVLEQGAINLANIRKTIIAVRESKLPDPKVLGNAGSFFMNPVVEKSLYMSLLEKYPSMPHYPVSEEEEKIPAGWLIEQCGWKGQSLGKVGVHEKQALVLINKGGAKGKDVVLLAGRIQESVREKFGIELVPEVNYIS